jgi:hypothetical protein
VREAWITQKDSPIMGKQLVNFITCGCEIGESFWVIQASLTTKTGHHDIAAILLKVPLSTIRSKSTQLFANQK